ncbi:MAG: hypothetical protein K8L99_25820 [Anaerolineae bacterium]|nr:hypothetical protein [Anaerolineae bacterium]
MQISRHWRLNAQRYRLEGFRHRNGEVSLQARPTVDLDSEQTQELAVVEQEPVHIAYTTVA